MRARRAEAMREALMEPVWDLVIVGAGPAGTSAALSALSVRPDARVLLLDRSGFPRDKACGDGIAPHVLDVLASVGVSGIERGYPGVDRLQIGFAAGPAADGVMARPAFVIPREVFDVRLVQAAVQRGAVLRQHRVRTVTGAHEDRPQVVDGTIRARVVIAADGASSVIRRQVAPRVVHGTSWASDSRFRWGFRPQLAGGGGAHTAVAIRGYAPVPCGRASHQEIVFAAANASGATWPAYAWSFPIGDGRANVGYGELLRPGRALSRQHLLERLEELLPGAAIGAQSWRAHLLPLSTGRPRQSDGRILFAGDAMNLINPVTGEGIFYAVASGVLAGRAAVMSGDPRRNAATDGELCDPGRNYRTALRTALGWHLRHTDTAAMLARSPTVVAAAVRAAGRRSGTFNDLVELGLGAGKLTPGALGSIAAALLRSRA